VLVVVITLNKVALYRHLREHSDRLNSKKNTAFLSNIEAGDLVS